MAGPRLALLVLVPLLLGRTAGAAEADRRCRVYIFTQLDAVQYQYGCFFDWLLNGGTAVVPAPAPLGTPCPR